MRRYRSSKRCRNYDRVLLAVYITADRDGHWNHATNAQIAGVAGLSAETVKHYLCDLEDDGVITVYQGFYPVQSTRLIVLMDHPHAATDVGALDRTLWRRGLELGRAERAEASR